MGHIRTDVPRPVVWPPPTQNAQIAAAQRYGRLRDPWGHRIHIALAMLYLLVLPVETAPKDWAWGILLGWTCIRMPHIWPCYAVLLRDRLMWLLMAWTAWHGLSAVWSADPWAGMDELGAFRVILTPLMLWPVLDRVSWLVGAFLLGVFAQNVVQAGQSLEWFGLHPGAARRLGGFLHPIQTGAFCAAAMCWHLSIVLTGRGWLRWMSLLGTTAAAGGLIFTGSRGPWLAAAIAVPLGLLVIGVRRPGARRVAMAVAVIGVVTAVATWPITGGFILSRIDQARTDLREATAGNYNSDVGLRLYWWTGAWAVFSEAPFTGTGAGGYRKALQEVGYGRLSHGDHHAHSLYLHELASTGVPGGLLVLAIVLVSVRRAWRDPPNHPCSDGTLFVLLSWLVGALFDAYQLNGHMFGLYALTVALTLPHRAASCCNADMDHTRQSSAPGVADEHATDHQQDA